MFCVWYNKKFSLSLELVIEGISPLHASKLIVTRDNKEFGHISHLVDVIDWVNNFHSLSELGAIDSCGNVGVNIVSKLKSKSIVRLPLSMNIFDKIWNNRHFWSNGNDFGSACGALNPT